MNLQRKKYTENTQPPSYLKLLTDTIDRPTNRTQRKSRKNQPVKLNRISKVLYIIIVSNPSLSHHMYTRPDYIFILFAFSLFADPLFLLALIR